MNSYNWANISKTILPLELAENLRKIIPNKKSKKDYRQLVGMLFRK